MMISVENIRKQAERAYPDFLSSIVTGEPFFPFDIRFGKRVMKGHYHAFAEKRDALLDAAAVVLLRDGDDSGSFREEGGVQGTLISGSASSSRSGYTVEIESRQSRRFGSQMLPVRIYFDGPDAYTSFLGRRTESASFCRALDETRRRLPELLPWIESNAVRVLPHVHEWTDLLDVCRYFIKHPRPDVYARELPLAVHTKFVEQHESILRQLLDNVLPDHAVDPTGTSFAERFGLKYDEPVVRLRALDRSLSAGWPADDVGVRVSSFDDLRPDAEAVIITENKMTFLTLPCVENGLALFGGGFKIEVLREAEWLRNCDVYYWGDLDAHGFMILSRLRSFVPKARSCMMDVETFERFREHARPGTPCGVESLPGLTPAEQAVFRSLARTNLRLEQERLSQAYAEEQIQKMLLQCGS